MSEISIARKPTPSQLATAREMKAHDEAVRENGESTLATSVYLDPAQFELERVRIFGALPIPVALSAVLPEPGTISCHRLLDTPILLTRAKDGVVRAFINACRHRGTQLVETGASLAAKLVVCPYHAWSYTLEGGLAGIALPDTFPTADKSQLGLVPLPSHESGGVIWVSLERSKPVDFTSVQGQLAEDLEATGLQEMRLYDRHSYTVAANWKLIMDAFLEGYHVRRLHSTTLAKFFVDSPTHVTEMGPHLRAAGPRAEFTPSSVAGDIDMAELGRVVSFGYTLFPTGVVITSPKYINVLLLNPVGIAETQANFFMAVRKDMTDFRSEDTFRRSFDLMHKAFGEEDLRAAELCQRGLTSGAIDTLFLGGQEQRIRLFHDSIARELAD